MKRTVWILGSAAWLLTACGNNKGAGKKDAEKESSDSFAALFRTVALPYSLSDTALLRSPSVAAISVEAALPDSVVHATGKAQTPKFYPLAKASQKGKETYYVMRRVANSKSSAVLLVFDNKNEFVASYPFLQPDNDPATTQVSSLDKNFTVTKSVTLRHGADVVGEGKEVVAYDATAKAFSLILSDALNDKPAELVNPIDTFPKKNALAGDYYLNKRNLVSVRDGRTPSQLLVFIHTENEAGDCNGVLKGEAILTSSTTAAYRQAGDPCVLNLVFKNNTVSMSEEKGCGNYRGLDCPLAGTFTRKKIQPAKTASAKARRK